MNKLLNLAQSYRNPACWLKNIVWRWPKTISDLECIFVVGSPRSGTTLLQRVLSSHSSLFSIPGETGLFSYQNLFSEDRRHFGLPAETLDVLYKDCRDVVDFFSQCVERVNAESEGTYFVEKTPQHVFYLSFLRKHFPKAKFINIVRDGRDCFCSSRTNPHIPQNRSVAEFASYWRNCVRKVIPLEDSDFIYTFRYEDFCSDAESTMCDCMRFLNLELEPSQLDAKNFGNDPRASVSHFSRLKEKVDTSSVERWRGELTKQECDQFERIAGSELRHFGYLKDGP